MPNAIFVPWSLQVISDGGDTTVSVRARITHTKRCCAVDVEEALNEWGGEKHLAPPSYELLLLGDGFHPPASPGGGMTPKCDRIAFPPKTREGNGILALSSGRGAPDNGL